MGVCVFLRGVQNYFRQIAIFVFGLVFVLASLPLCVLSVPIFIFRFILAKAAKWVRPDLGEILSSTGNMYSSDMFSGKSPRCSIIVSFLLEGNLTKEESHTIFNRMVTKTDKHGKLMYPEVRQYVEKWFGYPFWKNDPNFSLANHLISYESDKEIVTEKEVSQLTEQLLNKQFVKGRSPWEVHIVRNYHDPDLPPGKKTLLLLRVHHTMADGYSIVFALMEGALQSSINVMRLPNPNYFKRNGWSRLWNNIIFPLRLMNDVSHYFIKGLRKSPLNIPDAKKDWRQIYGKTRPVPIEKIKEIKRRLNVSFTSVLLAAVSASLSRIIRAKNKEIGSEIKDDSREKAAFFIPLPLPGHPNALKNHVTGAQIDLPLENYSDPTKRVIECEKLLQDQKKSTIPWLLIFLSRTLGLHPSELCGQITSNRVNISGLSSFPAGDNAIRLGLEDRKVLAIEAAVGGLTGISGVAFIAISYEQHMRFAVTAETAALSRREVDGLLAALTEEIDLLYDILMADF